jgi:transcriptional regulator GlxA family with amidase domain
LINLSVIASSKEPVSTFCPPGDHNPLVSQCAQSVVPTHTFSSPPAALEVLVVPGGFGSREPYIKETVEFIASVYPSLRYLITVCTGSLVVARTKILDGRRATTNKMAFKKIAEWVPEVEWVPKARWVVDGNIWSGSGLSAGLDVMLAFAEKVYGKEEASYVADAMEYERHTDPEWDPFSKGLGSDRSGV